MSLFDQVLNAINDPTRQGSVSQVAGAIQLLRQTAGSQNLQSDTTTLLVSTLGRYVQNSLQQKRATEGDAAAAHLVDQYSGTQPNPDAVSALFSPVQKQQATQDLAQKTGLNGELIAQLLPTLLPLILQFLQTGASTGGASQASANPVLQAFLDSDRDGDVDVSDLLGAASTFLGERH